MEIATTHLRSACSLNVANAQTWRSFEKSLRDRLPSFTMWPLTIKSIIIASRWLFFGVAAVIFVGNEYSGEIMSTAKESMIDIIGRQPEDSTYDEILRELAFARMVQRGLDDSDANRTICNDDMKRKIESWQK